ncbi:MAG: hypothetical protein HY595_04755, partial [Candidatus Omnitrophica bacterium]|nr:hypothetical protein [Candidatus Omnitrophota bacterium]
GGSNYGINPATGGWEPGMGGGMAYGGPQGGMPSVEQMQAMGMTAEQIQMAQTHTEGNYGMNPATGGWEPGMGGSAYMPEGWAQNQTGDFHFVGTEGSNYGINPATGGWEPGMGGGTTTWEGTGGGTVYGGGETWTQTSEGNWVSSSGDTVTPTTSDSQTQANQERQAETQTAAAHTLVTTHPDGTEAHPDGGEEHWDGNGDGQADHVHPIGTAAH